MIQSVSIILPTLNEATHIEQTIASIQQYQDDAIPLEIIVVDGGSGDHTTDLALRSGAKVVLSTKGRANQMNAGAQIAEGEVLLFLHADTVLPQDFSRHIVEVLNRPGAIAGAFELEIDGPERLLRWVEYGVHWRSHFFRMPYGDQALFMRSTVFKEVGGFPSLPIMEDVELVKRLRSLGTLYMANAAVRTSARRWQTLGIVRTTLINQLMLLAFWVGVSPNRIAHWYRMAPKWWSRNSQNRDRR